VPLPLGSTTTTPARKPKLTLRRVSLRTALRRGFVITVKGAKPRATIRLTARSGSTTLATGRGKARADGTVSIRLRFTVAGRRRLKRATRVKLKIRGTGLPTLTTTLRR
jgi:hypothetical protein